MKPDFQKKGQKLVFIAAMNIE